MAIICGQALVCPAILSKFTAQVILDLHHDRNYFPMPGEPVQPPCPQGKDCPDPTWPDQVGQDIIFILVMEACRHGELSAIVQVIQRSSDYNQWIEKEIGPRMVDPQVTQEQRRPDAPRRQNYQGSGYFLQLAAHGKLHA